MFRKPDMSKSSVDGHNVNGFMLDWLDILTAASENTGELRHIQYEAESG